MGRGDGQVVSVFAFYSDDPSSNPAEDFSFFCNIVFEKNKNKQKGAAVGPLLNNYSTGNFYYEIGSYRHRVRILIFKVLR